MWSPEAYPYYSATPVDRYQYTIEGHCVPCSGLNMVKVVTDNKWASITSHVLSKTKNNFIYGQKPKHQGEFLYSFAITMQGPLQIDSLSTSVEVMCLDSLELTLFDEYAETLTSIDLRDQGPLNVVPGQVGSFLPSDFLEEFRCLAELRYPIPPKGAARGEMYMMRSKAPAESLSMWLLMDNVPPILSAGESSSLAALEDVFRFYARNGEPLAYTFTPKLVGGRHHSYSFASF